MIFANKKIGKEGIASYYAVPREADYRLRFVLFVLSAQKVQVRISKIIIAGWDSNILLKSVLRLYCDKRRLVR